MLDAPKRRLQHQPQNQLKKLCQKTFLSWMRMREWRDIHRQLTLICREQKLTLNSQPANYDAVHKAILAGLLGQVAVKVEKREYLATRNRKVMIFPGSKVGKTAPKWIVAAEIVETRGAYVGQGDALTAEAVAAKWDEITDKKVQTHFNAGGEHGQNIFRLLAEGKKG